MIAHVFLRFSHALGIVQTCLLKALEEGPSAFRMPLATGLLPKEPARASSNTNLDEPRKFHDIATLVSGDSSFQPSLVHSP